MSTVAGAVAGGILGAAEAVVAAAAAGAEGVEPTATAAEVARADMRRSDVRRADARRADAPAPALAAASVDRPSSFDALFDGLLGSDEAGAAIGTSTRPIVLPEASMSPADAEAPLAGGASPQAHEAAAAHPETRRSRAAAPSTRPAKRGRSRRRATDVPPVPRGRATRAGAGPFADTAAAAASTAPAGSSRPGAAKPGRLRRRAARMTTLVAMSFAALLAVATSVPSLSLLSAADVQAMALSGSDSGRQPGQTIDTSGDAIASPNVDLESYKSQTIAEYAAAAGIRAEATFTNNPNGTIQWPFAVGVHIGDRFGYRDCAGCSSDHHGQDFNPGYGADIQAIADGVVSQSTDNGGSLGVVMMIDHVIDGQVVTSVYAHMVSGSRRFEVGDTVKVGDVIGETGNTGMSTGPHLHFEIRLGGVNGTWTDPLEWLYANTN